MGKGTGKTGPLIFGKLYEREVQKLYEREVKTSLDKKSGQKPKYKIAKWAEDFTNVKFFLVKKGLKTA